MARQDRIGSYMTSINHDKHGFTNVVYFNTTVVSFNNEVIFLDSGRYLTKSTKDRMNQTSSEYNLGYHVFQQRGNWFVSFGNYVHEFEDGMCLYRHNFKIMQCNKENILRR